MPVPGEQLILVCSNGTHIEVDALIEKLRRNEDRVLADDEIGLVLYVGDLGIYNLKPTDSGEFLAQPVTQISRPRFYSYSAKTDRGNSSLCYRGCSFCDSRGSVTKEDQS